VQHTAWHDAAAAAGSHLLSCSERGGFDTEIPTASILGSNYMIVLARLAHTEKKPLGHALAYNSSFVDCPRGVVSHKSLLSLLSPLLSTTTTTAAAAMIMLNISKISHVYDKPIRKRTEI